MLFALPPPFLRPLLQAFWLLLLAALLPPSLLPLQQPSWLQVGPSPETGAAEHCPTPSSPARAHPAWRQPSYPTPCIGPPAQTGAAVGSSPPSKPARAQPACQRLSCSTRRPREPAAPRKPPASFGPRTRTAGSACSAASPRPGQHGLPAVTYIPPRPGQYGLPAPTGPTRSSSVRSHRTWHQPSGRERPSSETGAAANSDTPCSSAQAQP